MDYKFLLDLAIILIFTKVFGIVCKRIGLPEVVGALLAGIILGPSLLDFISFQETAGEVVEYMAELGVIFLMFGAGLETDIKQMKENIVASFVVAALGVLVPLVCGFASYAIFFRKDITNYNTFLESLFIGVVLTATSVSITVQTLREMGKLQGQVGTTILGAAVIDDILGIIVLTIVSSLKDTSVSPARVMMKILLYAAMIAFMFLFVNKGEFLIEKTDGHRRATIFAIAFCLILSYISESVFGIADITGAYFAGLMLCTSKVKEYIDIKIESISNTLFGAIFFASIGLKVSLGGMDIELWGFAAVLTIVAILTKVVGCGLGALCCKIDLKSSFQIGVGMISRGEVALIVAEKGRQFGLISTDMFAPIVVVVIVTTLLTPIFLKWVFAEKESKPAEA